MENRRSLSNIASHKCYHHKPRQFSLLLALIAGLCGIVAGPPVQGTTYTTVILTHSGADDEFLNLNNKGQMVWQYAEGTSIKFYDGTTITQISNPGFYNGTPDINDNGQFVWNVYDGNDYEIFYYDGTNTIQLTDNDINDIRPVISNNGQIVWYGDDPLGSDTEIFIYDGTNIIQFTHDDNIDRSPNINDSGQITWSGCSDTVLISCEIFLFDGTNTLRLTTNTIADTGPGINYSGHVVWSGNEETPGSDDEIYFYDGSNNYRLTDNDVDDTDYQINNNDQIAWLTWNGTSTEIIRYDHLPVPTTLQLAPAGRPHLNDSGQIAWVYGLEAYVFDGATTIQLSNTLGPARAPQINDRGQVAWDSSVMGGGTQIFIATPYTDEANAGLVLLFDTSGSMSWRVDGSSPAPQSEQRISFAKEATKAFLQMFNFYSGDQANIGIATFPAHPSPSPFSCTGQVVSAMERINNDTKYVANNYTIPSLTTKNSTPLLAGVETAAGMFGSETNKAVVVLSDGYHNCPDYVTVGEDATLTTLVDQLKNNSVRVFTIGFGKPTDPDHELLAYLADQTTPESFSGSQFHDVSTLSFNPDTWDPWDPENTPLLNATYKDILVDALNLEAAADPLGVISTGETKRRKVHINEHDSKISFFLSWRTMQMNRLSLTVVDSSGHPVSPTADGVKLLAGDSYQILTVEPPYLTKPGVIGPSAWRIDIGTPGVNSGETEPYQYSVIMNSALKFQPGIKQVGNAAGDTITVSAKLSEAEHPLSDLEVEVIITAPKNGKGNWLSTHPVSAKELAQIPEIRGSEKLAPFIRKALFLTEIRGIEFPTQVRRKTLHLFDDASHGDATAGDGIYTNRFTKTGKEGVYSFRFRTHGKTQGKNQFERERVIQTHLTVRAHPKFTDYIATRLQAGKLKQYQIKVIPKDTLRNYLGPGHESVVHFDAKGGRFVGELQDNLDGGYSQTLQVARNVNEKHVWIYVNVQKTSIRFNLADMLREHPCRDHQCQHH